MKNLLVVSAVIALAGCASSQSAQKAATAPLTWCNPCAQPCTPDCGKVAVAAPAPAPKPQPPPPAPPPPAPPEPTAAARLSPAPGTYEMGQSVTATSDTAGAVVHCTTDGSAPTAASPEVSGPIAVEKSATVRCIAVAPGQPESAVTGGEYVIQPPAPKRVEVKETKLELTEKVYFDTGKSTIKPVSYSLLDDVAQVLKDHPEVKKVRIEGHTDSKGSAKLNTSLSKARAQAVRKYLVDKGVEAPRLEATGYGPKKPIADNATAEGREKNRRVEFMITAK